MAVELYDEHEQSERVRNWVREYGASIVTGVLLAVAGVFGIQYWQTSQHNQRILASEYLEVIREEVANDQLDFALEQFAAMREAVGDSAQTGLAALLLAGAQVKAGQLEAAAQALRDVLTNPRLESIRPIATLRLARVVQAQGDFSGALALLDEMPAAGFEGAWAEVRGDLLLAAGQPERARDAYQQALELAGDSAAGQSLLQLKIDATAPGVLQAGVDQGETS